MALFEPQSTGVTFALTEKAPGDKMPLLTVGYGLAAAQDGFAFKWNFPVLGSYWTGADVLVQYLKKKEGGSLKGKKIALAVPRLGIRQGADTAAPGARPSSTASNCN